MEDAIEFLWIWSCSSFAICKALHLTTAVNMVVAFAKVHLHS